MTKSSAYRISRVFAQPYGPSDRWNSLSNQCRYILTDAINKTKRAIARLIDAYAEGLLDKQDFEPRLHAARARLVQLETQLRSQNELQAGQAEMRLIIGSIETFATKVKQGLAEADPTAKRDIIRALVKRVEVNDEQVNLVYRINPNSNGDASAQPVLQDCPTDAGAMP